MARSGECANAWKELDVVAIDQVDTAFGIQLDERLHVAGIERLRVIDASAMPTITSGNTNAPTMMIAEKGAALLREDAKAPAA